MDKVGENLSQNISPFTEPAVITPISPANQPPFGSWWKVGVGALLVAGGLFFVGYQYFPKQIPKTPPSTIVSTPDPTSNWKIYRSNKYKYEFKYPQYLYLKTPSVAENTETFLFEEYRDESPRVNQPEFGVMAISGGRTLEEMVKSIKLLAQETDQKLNLQEIKLSGEKAYRNENILEGNNPFSNITTLVNNDNIEYQITLFSPDINKHRALYNQILSTFQFID